MPSWRWGWSGCGPRANCANSYTDATATGTRTAEQNTGAAQRAEREQQLREQAERRAEQLAERLRALDIDPDELV